MNFPTVATPSSRVPSSLGEVEGERTSMPPAPAPPKDSSTSLFDDLEELEELEELDPNELLSFCASTRQQANKPATTAYLSMTLPQSAQPGFTWNEKDTLGGALTWRKRQQDCSTQSLCPLKDPQILKELIQHRAQNPPPSDQSYKRSRKQELFLPQESLSNTVVSRVPEIRGPTPKDIICGRGKFMYCHPGSVRFRDIVKKAVPYYEASNSRSLKKIVIDLVLDEVYGEYGKGIRFLKYNSTSKSWSAMGDKQIRDKIGHALRDAVFEKKRMEGQNK